MTRHLHIDPFSGIAGDMLLGALVDLGVGIDDLVGPLRSIGVPDWELVRTDRRDPLLGGARVEVRVGGEDAGGAWFAGDGHVHLDRILAAIAEARDLPSSVRDQAAACFRRLASAEAQVHRVADPADVGLHEVGAVDAVIDICGSLLGLHLLGVQSVSCAPVPLGSGFVTCAHGLVPVPVPATLELLLGIPTGPAAGEHPTGELVTPTGAALLRTVVDRFGPPPPMTLDRVGHGLGGRTRDVPNALRLMLGTASAGAPAPEAPTVHVLCTTIDDLEPRLIEPLIAALMNDGALDVTVTAAHGKKGRPTWWVEALAADGTSRRRLEDRLFRDTPTLGVRARIEQRRTLPRAVRSVRTPWGSVRVKEATLDGAVVTRQPEFEDCRRLAEGAEVPLSDVIEAARGAAAIRDDAPE